MTTATATTTTFVPPPASIKEDPVFSLLFGMKISMRHSAVVLPLIQGMTLEREPMQEYAWGYATFHGTCDVPSKLLGLNFEEVFRFLKIAAVEAECDYPHRGITGPKSILARWIRQYCLERELLGDREQPLDALRQVQTRIAEITTYVPGSDRDGACSGNAAMQGPVTWIWRGSSWAGCPAQEGPFLAVAPGTRWGEMALGRIGLHPDLAPWYALLERIVYPDECVRAPEGLARY